MVLSILAIVISLVSAGTAIYMARFNVKAWRAAQPSLEVVANLYVTVDDIVLIHGVVVNKSPVPLTVRTLFLGAGPDTALQYDETDTPRQLEVPAHGGTPFHLRVSNVHANKKWVECWVVAVRTDLVPHVSAPFELPVPARGAGGA
jgi:hypothetical protein